MYHSVRLLGRAGDRTQGVVQCWVGTASARTTPLVPVHSFHKYLLCISVSGLVFGLICFIDFCFIFSGFWLSLFLVCFLVIHFLASWTEPFTHERATSLSAPMDERSPECHFEYVAQASATELSSSAYSRELILPALSLQSGEGASVSSGGSTELFILY